MGSLPSLRWVCMKRTDIRKIRTPYESYGCHHERTYNRPAACYKFVRGQDWEYAGKGEELTRIARILSFLSSASLLSSGSHRILKNIDPPRKIANQTRTWIRTNLAKQIIVTNTTRVRLCLQGLRRVYYLISHNRTLSLFSAERSKNGSN